ncbi:hypothetical protein GW17_00011178 [Ensete ventricosum]|nr:hypothetical protein GW17_00011178 [Ensete ventricosum]
MAEPCQSTRWLGLDQGHSASLKRVAFTLLALLVRLFRPSVYLSIIWPWWQPMPPLLAMAAGVAHLHISPHPFNHLGSRDVARRDHGPRPRHCFDRNTATYDGISFLGPGICLQRAIPPFLCRSLRSENRGEETSSSDSPSPEGDGRTVVVKDERETRKLKRKGPLYSLKSMLLRLSGSDSRPVGQNRKLVEKAEEIFFTVSSSLKSLSVYYYAVKFPSIFVSIYILFQFFVPNYSNLILEGSPESVHQTVEELRENLKDGLAVSKNKARKNLSHAMVVGIACDVCKPEDVRKLANFAVDELGSVDIWVSLYILDILSASINNAGTNKGFRPLLQFTDDDIDQVCNFSFSFHHQFHDLCTLFYPQGRALYAAEADRIRNWAESRARFSFTDAMEMYAENTWVSVFSLSVVCAFIILSSSGNAFHGT